MKMNEDSRKTQRKNTIGTYRKIKEMLTPGNCLDYGAGLMHGTELFKSEGINTESFEPFAEEGLNPDYTTPENVPQNAYNNVVCNCVLNVIEDPQSRVQTVRNILNALRTDGTAFIMARKPSDVKSNVKTATEVGSCEYKFENGCFQKGFSNKSLREFVEEIAGNGFKLESITGLSPAAVKVTRVI